MAKWAFMIDPATNNIGLFDEPVPASSEADYEDPGAPCNAPLNDPEGNLAQVYWHIQLDNMEVFRDVSPVTISHPAVPAGATSSGSDDNTGNIAGQAFGMGSGFDYSFTPIDYVLDTHDLGYEPMAYAAVGTKIISPGYIVQVPGTYTGAARYVSIWCDTTKVYLREFASRGSAILAAQNVNYRVITLRRQRAAEGNDPPKHIDFNETTGLLKMGDGRFAGDRKYLQVVPGGTPFGLALGRTIDLANGAPRFVAVDGTVYDPVPSTFALSIRIGGATAGGGSASAPTPGNYTGSFAGDTVIQVQAP